MRLIGTIDDERQGMIFSLFLSTRGIAHQLDISKNTDWGSPDYGAAECRVWIREEDQVDDAMKWYQLFRENPLDPIFKSGKFERPLDADQENIPLVLSQGPIEDKVKTPETSSQRLARQPMGLVTRCLLIGMTLIFLAAQFLTPHIKGAPDTAVVPLFSPIEKALLYDYPQWFELLERFFKLYGYEGFEDQSSLPPEAHQLVKQINNTPYWQGLYHNLLTDDWSFKAPMFEKIRQGEFWRLLSPAALHANFLHLFFNMLWLIVLGKQIELRIKAGRYILFIILVGIVTNTAEYLMSGFMFVGFSGILTAMLAFIWVRQQKAVWEGYNLDKATILFMMVYLLAMAAIQFFSFFLERGFSVSISPGVANVAHLTGLLMGYLLGKLNYFSWRHN